MVTRPTATGSVGGSPPRSSVMEKKMPVAKAKAAIHSNAAATRSLSRPMAASLPRYRRNHRVVQRLHARIGRLDVRLSSVTPDRLGRGRTDRREQRAVQ